MAQFKRKAGGYAFLGSSPAILGGPQKASHKFHSGILEQYYCMRNTQEPSQLDEWLRGRRRSSSLMALMAHQISLILLFLWPHSLDFDDSSCDLEGWSVVPPPGKVWDQSIHCKVGNYRNGKFQKTPGRNSNQSTPPLPKVNKRFCLALFYLHSHQFSAWSVWYWQSYSLNGDPPTKMGKSALK